MASFPLFPHLPGDLRLRYLYKFFEFPDFIHYCQTAKEYYHLLSDSKLWDYYVQRDLKISYSGKSKGAVYLAIQRYRKRGVDYDRYLEELGKLPFHELAGPDFPLRRIDIWFSPRFNFLFRTRTVEIWIRYSGAEPVFRLVINIIGTDWAVKFYIQICRLEKGGVQELKEILHRFVESYYLRPLEEFARLK